MIKKLSGENVPFFDIISTMPKFSVIVPVYNVEPYLREALDSVLNQTCSDWECLCVDDGSTDGSGTILDEYAEKDKRFKVFHIENQGVSAARNLALDHATGEWLAFLDGDDTYNTILFENVMPLMDIDEEVDAVQFKYIRVQEMPKTNPATKTKHSIHDLRKKIPRFAMQSYCWDKIYRRRVSGEVRFEKAPLGEDALYSAECVRRFRKIIRSEFCGYFYRLRPGSASNGGLEESSFSTFRDLFRVWLAMAKIWLKEGRRLPYHLKASTLVKVSGRVSDCLKNVPPSPEVDAFMKEWIAGLKELLAYPLPFHYRLAFRAVIKHPRLHSFLFRFPLRVKRFLKFIHVTCTFREYRKRRAGAPVISKTP